MKMKKIHNYHNVIKYVHTFCIPDVRLGFVPYASLHAVMYALGYPTTGLERNDVQTHLPVFRDAFYSRKFRPAIFRAATRTFYIFF